MTSERATKEQKLVHAFRNVDKLDWQHLAMWIPDSGHGRFWKGVLAEVRTALAETPADA